MATTLPRIMMVSSEATPWAKSGGLADVLGALPFALAALGHPVCVVIPRYMDAHKADAARVIDYLQIPLGGNMYPISVWASSAHGVTNYFVDQPGLYGRVGIYGDAHGEFGDNHLRFALLSKAALEISRRVFHADIFHCHDWQTGLLPVYLKESSAVDPAFLGTQTMLTIHNLGYQGVFDRGRMADVSLPAKSFRPDGIEFWGKISYLKAGVAYADALTTVSPTYAKEIQTPEFGFSMEGLLHDRRAVLTGIINGVDYSVWNTDANPHLPAPYDAKNLKGKRECKSALIAEMGLDQGAIEKPLLAVVTRFASQKGPELMAAAARRLIPEGAYLAVLGNGDAYYEQMFQTLADEFPGKVGLSIQFSAPLSHRMEAGADIFLMPSAYEPCGLNQMYSLRYGTVPVVHATGGLNDSVDETTGFKFIDYNEEAFIRAVRAACTAWQDRKSWEAMMVRGMLKDFSWAASAAEYSRLYGALHPAAG